MKNILLVFIFIINSFAISDYIAKPILKNTRVLYSTIDLKAPVSLDTDISEDDKNVYKYKGHFRVIFGIDYKDSTLTNDLAESILEIANEVWNKEVEEFGFKKPRNSDTFYIDIYIGNKSSYNYDTKDYMSISSSYAGYATGYSNGTPYFIINPSISLDILKVTIAHEFFHTIQYAYGFDRVNDDIWSKNIWFLEATAVMMEDEVFTDVNDYKNYIDYYLPHTTKSIEYYNGAIEYGKVVFAKYLMKTYGIKFIKDVLENYETNETALDDLKKELQNDYNQSFADMMIEYGNCLVNLKSCFETEDLTSDKLSKYNIDSTINIETYGIAFFNEGDDYLISSTPDYTQSDFYNNTNTKENITTKGLIFVNAKKTSISTDILKSNKALPIHIKTGWNLISNVSDNNISLEDLDITLIWIYRDGKYYAYSSNERTKKLIKEYGYEMDENVLYPNEGAWIYAENEYDIDLLSDKLIDYKNNVLKSGWNLIAFSSNVYDLNNMSDDVLIWHYEDGEWKYFSKTLDLEGVTKLNKLYPQKGYFILKK